MNLWFTGVIFYFDVEKIFQTMNTRHFYTRVFPVVHNAPPSVTFPLAILLFTAIPFLQFSIDILWYTKTNCKTFCEFTLIFHLYLQAMCSVSIPDCWSDHIFRAQTSYYFAFKNHRMTDILEDNQPRTVRIVSKNEVCLVIPQYFTYFQQMR